MTTKVEIVSGAFTNLGKNPISDIDPATAPEIVITASKKYDLLLENSLSGMRWRFATLVRDLNLLVEEPIIKEFKNAFMLPANYLNMQRVTPFIFYRIYEDLLLTNSQSIQIEYTARVPEDKFPAWFTLLMEYRLTVDMAMPLTQQITVKKDWESSWKIQSLEAKYQDSQQQPSDVVQDDPILAAHLGNATGRLF